MTFMIKCVRLTFSVKGDESNKFESRKKSNLERHNKNGKNKKMKKPSSLDGELHYRNIRNTTYNRIGAEFLVFYLFLLFSFP